MQESKQDAYSPAQFAAAFGKSQSWAYRLIYSKKVKVITAFGNQMIPASEKERILGSADYAEMIKDTKTPKKGRGRPKKKSPWTQHLHNRRSLKTKRNTFQASALSQRRKKAIANNLRSAARARMRLTKANAQN